MESVFNFEVAIYQRIRLAAPASAGYPWGMRLLRESHKIEP